MIETNTTLCLVPGSPGSGLETKVEAVKFSYFSRPVTNTVPTRAISIWEAYLDIRSNRNQYQTDMLRRITDKTTARNYKAHNFNAVTFSGEFSKRCEAGLIRHTGLLCIDLDHVSNLQEIRATLLDDPFLESVLLFKSPSGDGLKWIVEINIVEHTHLQCFNAIDAYIKATYHLKMDAACKDVPRCCFLPFDPEVYINPQYKQ